MLDDFPWKETLFATPANLFYMILGVTAVLTADSGLLASVFLFFGLNFKRWSRFITVIAGSDSDSLIITLPSLHHTNLIFPMPLKFSRTPE